MTSTTTAAPAEERQAAGGPQHPSRITGADGLRALAALGVMLSHIFQRLGMDGQPEWLSVLQGVMMKGAYGVSIFFVLSGMLLSMPFWRSYLTGAPMPRIGHYARRRAARIVPGYWASLVVSFALVFALFPDAPHAVRRFVAGLTFTSGFHYTTFFPTETNGPLWSISFEVFSYVLMPLAMWGLFALGRRGFRFSAWYWAGVFIAVIALNQVIITVFQTGEDGKGWQYGNVGGAKEWMPYYNPVGFFGHFCLGIVAAGFIVWWQLRDGRRLRRFDVMAGAGLLLIIAMVLLTMFPFEPQYMFNFQRAPYLFPYLAAATALTLVGLSHSRTLWRAVDNRFFRWTATISFGIYIWHYLVLHLVSYLTFGEFEYSGVQNPVRFLWIALTVLVISYAVAALSWKFIEQPVLTSRWARKP